MYRALINKIKSTNHRKTSWLIDMASGMLRRQAKPLENDMNVLIAKGLCPVCKSKLVVSSTNGGEERIRFNLLCGHELLFIVTGEPHEGRGNTDGTRHSVIGQSMIMAERDGYIPNTTQAEISITHIFLERAYPEFIQVEKVEENSPIDTIAIAENGSRLSFQVTEMFTGDFWKKLNTEGRIDIDKLSTEDFSSLISEALKRKDNVDSGQKVKIILLIGAFPGISANHIAIIKQKLTQQLENIGYQEVWLVGGTPQLTYKLF